MNKAELFNLATKAIEAEIANGEKAMGSIRQESIDSPGAMQSHSDTNKFQAGHLANNLGTLIEAKHRSLEEIKSLMKDAENKHDKVGIGSIVEVEDHNSGTHSWYFILPSGGGTEVDYDSKRITSITSTAPFTKCLIGKAVGDIAEFPMPNNPDTPRKLKITDLY